MGLFTGLLTLPLAPVRGTAWLAERILEQAEGELNDESRVHGELLRLQELYESGVIDADELAASEDVLLERLLATSSGHGG